MGDPTASIKCLCSGRISEFRSDPLRLRSCVCYVAPMSPRGEQKHHFFCFALSNRDQIPSLCKIFRNFQSPVYVEVSMGTFPNPIAASREIHTYTEGREQIYRHPGLS